MSTDTEIHFKKALILGNFYNKPVKIVTKGYGVILDAIIGIKNNYAITKSNGLINRDHIQSICKIV